MKIKTITEWTDTPNKTCGFDIEVNKALEEGWTLTRREVFPSLKFDCPELLYAELVMPDPAPERTDPWDHVRAIKDFCDTVAGDTCFNDECPLSDWCKQMIGRRTPTSWALPEKKSV